MRTGMAMTLIQPQGTRGNADTVATFDPSSEV